MSDWVDRELRRSFRRASRVGEAVRSGALRAVGARYDARKQRLVVELANGVVLMLPPRLLQGLQDATPGQLARVRLSPQGGGLRWDELDVDLGVAGLAAGVFGSRIWMSELARQAGSRTSPRKAAAARENGRRGGRPRSRS
jgi:hypothetical protein